MDWLRRNWPDLLIGIALVAVIAGIIATLITGGSFFPVGQSTRTSTPPAQSATTQSSAPPAASSSTTSPSTSSTPSSTNGASNAAGSSAQAASGGSTNGTAGSGSAPAGGSAANGGSTAAAPSSGSGGGVAVLPPSDNGSSASSGAASSGAASGGAPSASSTASAAPPASSSAATSASPSTPAGNGPGAAAPFRISVGAFSHADYAQRQEQVFKNAGYPVFLADQGDLTIVLVGPYRTQSEADAVAAKIKGGGFGVDPVVYEFKGTQDSAPQPASPSAGGSATSSSSSSSASSATTSSSSTTASSSATAAGGQRYLQVGAYGSSESAKPQRDKLASMGYQVTERTESGLVKVLIGPFGPDKLQQVQSDLKAAGIDSFPR